MKKVAREYNLPKIEFVKFQLESAINHTHKLLNDTEITILAYVYHYGKDAKNRIHQDRILTNENSVKNYIARLTVNGYIIKEPAIESSHRGNKGYSNLLLNPNLKILDEDFIQVAIVKLNNSDTVYHHNFRK